MDRTLKLEKARAILEQLRINLVLSQEDAATMFGAPAELLRAWESGAVEVPESTLAQMIAAQTALDRLLGLFRADRLPQVIRRRAPVFNGERALAWILDGRIAEVAERYDNGLAYLRRTA